MNGRIEARLDTYCTLDSDRGEVPIRRIVANAGCQGTYLPTGRTATRVLRPQRIGKTLQGKAETAALRGTFTETNGPPEWFAPFPFERVSQRCDGPLASQLSGGCFVFGRWSRFGQTIGKFGVSVFLLI